MASAVGHRGARGCQPAAEPRAESGSGQAGDLDREEVRGGGAVRVADAHESEDGEDEEDADVEEQRRDEEADGGGGGRRDGVGDGGQGGEQAAAQARDQVPEGDRAEQVRRAEHGGQVEDEGHPEEAEREHQQQRLHPVARESKAALHARSPCRARVCHRTYPAWCEPSGNGWSRAGDSLSTRVIRSGSAAPTATGER
nr:hypothetical protein [Actinoplanes philippinensis]